MKSLEELNALKQEVETLSKKLAELSEVQLAQVTGGIEMPGSDDLVLDFNYIESGVEFDVRDKPRKPRQLSECRA